MDNLRIWNQVSKTNPEHTSKVEQRGGFTAIDAMYQIQRATEVFGPVGQGWGYRCDHGTIPVGQAIICTCDVVIWWSDGKQEGDEWRNTFGPIRGTNWLFDAKGRYDEDAPKKAMTDALTKGLSHLGFSADVFLGLYDDNKYVEQLKREFRQPPPVNQNDPDLVELKKFSDAIPHVTTIDGLELLKKEFEPRRAIIQKKFPAETNAAVMKWKQREAEFKASRQAAE